MLLPPSPRLPCRLASLGPLGVDALLVLSALLATYQLLPALEGSSSDSGSRANGGTRRHSKGGSGTANGGSGGGPNPAPSCWQAICCYWRRRAARILPAYAATLALLALALPPRAPAPPLEQAAARALAFGHCPAGWWWAALLASNLDAGRSCGECPLPLRQGRHCLAFPREPGAGMAGQP